MVFVEHMASEIAGEQMIERSIVTLAVEFTANGD